MFFMAHGVLNNSELIVYEQYKLPDIENDTLDRLYDFIAYLNDQRPFPAALIIMKLVPSSLVLAVTDVTVLLCVVNWFKVRIRDVICQVSKLSAIKRTYSFEFSCSEIGCNSFVFFCRINSNI